MSAESRASEIGRLLKWHREACGLTIEEAAAIAHVNPDHLRAIEEDAGGTHGRGPSTRITERVANVYGMTVAIVPHPDLIHRRERPWRLNP